MRGEVEPYLQKKGRMGELFASDGTKLHYEAYEKLLFDNGIIEAPGTEVPDDKTETHDVNVEDVIIVPVDGEATVYITGDNGNVYKAIFKNDESLILIRKGDKISVKCIATDIEKIYSIVSWKEAVNE